MDPHSSNPCYSWVNHFSVSPPGQTGKVHEWSLGKSLIALGGGLLPEIWEEKKGEAHSYEVGNDIKYLIHQLLDPRHPKNGKTKDVRSQASDGLG